MFKWKIGDHVRVIDEESAFYGREGFVDHYDEELFHNVFVRFQGNNQCNFRIKELEAVTLLNSEKPRIRKWNRSGVQCEGAGISRIGYDMEDAYERWLMIAQHTRERLIQRVTTGHCKNKNSPGGCQLHNLQCGYPACDKLGAGGSDGH